MQEKNIRIYHTHIEVYPYQYGESPKVERMVSTWNNVEKHYNPIGYMILDDVLYLPRGFSIMVLEDEFRCEAFTVRTPDDAKRIPQFKMMGSPRNQVQKEGIGFLTGEGEYAKYNVYSQLVLILRPGTGKTFITVNAILKLRQRTLIITHQDKIRNQWISTFKDFTNLPEEKIIMLTTQKMYGIETGEEIPDGYVYMVNHKTLNLYMAKYGRHALTRFVKALKVGLKVYDEAHLEFYNTLQVDFLTNTEKTIYLTATFDRSDAAESRVFKKAFASAAKYGSDLITNRKHIIYVPVLYRSDPTMQQIYATTTAYGFSAQRFSMYALHKDTNQTMLMNLMMVLDIATRLSGKILITTSKIEDTEKLAAIIGQTYPDREISTINSNRTKEDNDEAKKADIICSTIRSCGTGVDIHGLRTIINLEPFSSAITCDQLSGRLREYSPEDDTYFFDFVDLAFPSCERQYQNRLKNMRKKCKQVSLFRV